MGLYSKRKMLVNNEAELGVHTNSSVSCIRTFAFVLYITVELYPNEIPKKSIRALFNLQKTFPTQGHEFELSLIFFSESEKVKMFTM